MNSRIVLDVVGYGKHHFQRNVPKAKEERQRQPTHTLINSKVRNVGSFGLSKKSMSNNRWSSYSGRYDTSTKDDSANDDDNKARVMRRVDKETQAKNKAEMLALPKDLMYIYPWVEGYSLENKLWSNHPLVRLKAEAFFMTNIFSSLILHREHPDTRPGRDCF